MGSVVLFALLAGRASAREGHRFDWGNAAIGAVTALGVLLLVLGVALVVLQARIASRPEPPER